MSLQKKSVSSLQKGLSPVRCLVKSFWCPAGHTSSGTVTGAWPSWCKQGGQFGRCEQDHVLRSSGFSRYPALQPGFDGVGCKRAGDQDPCQGCERGDLEGNRLWISTAPLKCAGGKRVMTRRDACEDPALESLWFHFGSSDDVCFSVGG